MLFNIKTFILAISIAGVLGIGWIVHDFINDYKDAIRTIESLENKNQEYIDSINTLKQEADKAKERENIILDLEEKTASLSRKNKEYEQQLSIIIDETQRSPNISVEDKDCMKAIVPQAITQQLIDFAIQANKRGTDGNTD